MWKTLHGIASSANASNFLRANQHLLDAQQALVVHKLHRLSCSFQLFRSHLFPKKNSNKKAKKKKRKKNIDSISLTCDVKFRVNRITNISSFMETFKALYNKKKQTIYWKLSRNNKLLWSIAYNYERKYMVYKAGERPHISDSIYQDHPTLFRIGLQSIRKYAGQKGSRKIRKWNMFNVIQKTLMWFNPFALFPPPNALLFIHPGSWKNCVKYVAVMQKCVIKTTNNNKTEHKKNWKPYADMVFEWSA